MMDNAKEFDDVKSGDWYAEGQKWAMAEKNSDGVNPRATVSRERLATMLWRMAGSPEAENPKGLENYTDADQISDFAASAMRWAQQEGILTGKGGNRLDPTGSATRAEFAAILMRFSESKIQ